jgi:hypothetical protein
MMTAIVDTLLNGLTTVARSQFPTFRLAQIHLQKCLISSKLSWVLGDLPKRKLAMRAVTETTGIPILVNNPEFRHSNLHLAWAMALGKTSTEHSHHLVWWISSSLI